jgi:hypothetical protein
MYFHELIRTAVESKILLFDAKLDNVLYNENYPYYEPFKIREQDLVSSGRVILIDFGQVYLMTESEANEFSYEKFTYVNEAGVSVIRYFDILKKIFFRLCELIEDGTTENFNTNTAIFCLLIGIIRRRIFNDISLYDMKSVMTLTFEDNPEKGVSNQDNRDIINNGLVAIFTARQRKIKDLLNGSIPIFGTEPDKRQEKITRLSNSVRRLNKSFLFDISKYYVITPLASESRSRIRDFINWVTRCNASVNDVVDPSQRETGISIDDALHELNLLGSDIERGGKRKKTRKRRNRRNKNRTQRINCKKKKRISRRFSKFK